MNRQWTIGLLAVTVLLASLGSACSRGDDKAVKGRDGPNGAAHDTVSDLALNEDGHCRKPARLHHEVHSARTHTWRVCRLRVSVGVST